MNLFITGLSGCDLGTDPCHAAHRCQPGVTGDTGGRARAQLPAEPRPPRARGDTPGTLPRHHVFCGELPRRTGARESLRHLPQNKGWEAPENTPPPAARAPLCLPPRDGRCGRLGCPWQRRVLGGRGTCSPWNRGGGTPHPQHPGETTPAASQGPRRARHRPGETRTQHPVPGARRA